MGQHDWWKTPVGNVALVGIMGLPNPVNMTYLKSHNYQI